MEIADRVMLTFDEIDGEKVIEGMITMISRNETSLMISVNAPMAYRLPAGGLAFSDNVALLRDEDGRYHDLLTDRIIKVELRK